LGDAPVSLEWSIGTSPFASDVGSGTAALANVATGTFRTSFLTFASTFAVDVAVSPGTTYWLTLQDGLTQRHDEFGWFESGGPSLAQDTAHGTIASESFELFDASVVAAPEPASRTLAGLGALGLLACGWPGRKPAGKNR
jgi:hypothetical protein